MLRSKRLLATLLVLSGLSAWGDPVSAQSLPTTHLGDAAGPPGSAVIVPLIIDNPALGPIQGMSFSFWSPDGVVAASDVFLGPALAELNGGDGPDFLSIALEIDPIGGIGIGCGTVFSFFGSDALDPGVGLHALDMEWTIDPVAAIGTLGSVDFCDCLGSPPLASTVVIGGASIVPIFDPAAIEVVALPEFVRGDPNASGGVDIADPIYALNFLFQSGEAICLDAMDANADGALDLADPLYLLAFINGSGPAPEMPYPDCGAAAVLGCDEFAACP
ncbi:MAG: hypothetical protein KDC38_10795 [Planctomycetes bacterium]|nr:hypothetical protein [Planctomycetota bacterium]